MGGTCVERHCRRARRTRSGRCRCGRSRRDRRVRRASRPDGGHVRRTDVHQHVDSYGRRVGGADLSKRLCRLRGACGGRGRTATIGGGDQRDVCGSRSPRRPCCARERRGGGTRQLPTIGRAGPPSRGGSGRDHGDLDERRRSRRGRRTTGRRPRDDGARLVVGLCQRVRANLHGRVHHRLRRCVRRAFRREDGDADDGPAVADADGARRGGRRLSRSAGACGGRRRRRPRRSHDAGDRRV